MAEQVQELIDKIKTEGIEVARRKAQEIEADAQKRSEQIIADTKKEAKRLLEAANNESKMMKATTENELKQAIRDTLLNLKKTIQDLLRNIISENIQDALTPENLADIIGVAVENFFDKKSKEESITIALNKSDLDKLKEGFTAKLQAKMKEGVEFKATEDIDKGFTVSFDEGKSCFDFTDSSLAEYLSAYLSTEINTLLKDAMSS